MLKSLTNHDMRTLPFIKKHQRVSSGDKVTNMAEATGTTSGATAKPQPKPLPDFENMDLKELLLAEEPRVEGFSIPGRDDSPNEAEGSKS